MICKKKQIQIRKLPPPQTITQQPKHKNINLFTKKYHNNQHDTKTQDIDPWHTMSHVKLCSASNTRHNLSATNNYPSIRNSLPYCEAFQLNLSALQNQPFSSIEDPPSPTKLKMLECSFRFEEYEQHKAQQMKNSLMNVIIKNSGKREVQNMKVKQKNKRNFVEKNIRNAFEIDNFYNQNFVQNQRKKSNKITICSQIKQRLLRDKQRLKLQSKQLQNNFVLMKNHQRSNKNQTKSKRYCFKQPNQTVWNMIYVEKSTNPQFNQRTDKCQRIFRSRGKGDQTQKSQKQSHRNLLTQGVATQSHGLKSQLAKSNKQLSRKLHRMWKSKNKSKMSIEPQEQDQTYYDQKERAYRRIHSLTPSKRDQELSVEQVAKVQNYFDYFSKRALLAFKPPSKKNSKPELKPRSFSAIGRRSSSALGQRSDVNGSLNEGKEGIRLYQKQNILKTKNFLLCGNHCQFAQIFVE